ncbi:MAG: hypothetical protein H5T69_15600 [Chloroflexi bacterium]|nr:hypothetical protein [Chloroflexota bacterium]
MNHRERILAVLNREPPDRLPWAPRILLWYRARQLTHTMPQEYEGLSLREVERKLDIATAARDGKVFDAVHDDSVQVEEREEGGKRITEYHTPVGSVRQVMHFSRDLEEQGLPGRVEEFLLKGPKDYKVWEYVVEHTDYVPAYDAYRAYDADIGEDGLPLVGVGDVPLHHFAQALAGYEYAYYQLMDYTQDVEHLLAVMAEVDKAKKWPVIAESPARLLLHGVHLSSQWTPPRYFRKYILPYYREFMPMMHEHGKSVAMHADNDTSAILNEIEEAGWDMVECFVTAPMVPLTLREARERWGTRVIIWGGVPSLILSPSYSEEDFRAYMYDAFKVIAPGDAFILGVADNVMPDSLIDRVRWITDLVHERGRYPMSG